MFSPQAHQLDLRMWQRAPLPEPSSPGQEQRRQRVAQSYFGSMPNGLQYIDAEGDVSSCGAWGGGGLPKLESSFDDAIDS